MVDDIKDSKHLHNIGIDIDAVAGAKVQSNNQLTPAVPKEKEQPIQSQNSSADINTREELEQKRKGTTEESQVDTEQLKKEIFQTTTAQLQDLAKQFQQFANRVNARLDELDKQVQRVSGSVSSQQTIQSTEQPKQEAKPAEKPKEPAKNKEDEYSSDDVSVDKIFNFSNTKGQSNPRPNN